MFVLVFIVVLLFSRFGYLLKNRPRLPSAPSFQIRLGFHRLAPFTFFDNCSRTAPKLPLFVVPGLYIRFGFHCLTPFVLS